MRRMEVQPEILELLLDIPVCTGLGVRRDIKDIEDFYSTISGKDIEMLGFIDLSSLAIAAGYKLRAKNMTAMGVQVMGTILNKCVSTGDNQWGQIWSHIPAALQVYALGDIKFGFITYNVLAGILIRDLLPDPEILCKLLECSQKTAVEWILEWFVKSLEGVESHQDTEEHATDRVSLMKTLKFRDSRNKLEKSEPP